MLASHAIVPQRRQVAAFFVLIIMHSTLDLLMNIHELGPIRKLSPKAKLYLGITRRRRFGDVVFSFCHRARECLCACAARLRAGTFGIVTRLFLRATVVTLG